jgi:hypothetical protein
MPEELMDANGEAKEAGPAAESSPVAEVETKEPVKASAETNSVQQPKEESLPFHEHPRFKELINEKNQLRDQLSNMERILQKQSEPAKPSPYDAVKQKMLGLGLEDKAAQELVDSMKTVANAAVDSRVQPIEAASVQREIDGWTSDLAKEHEDFDSLRPQMYEVFRALPDTIQQLVSSHPIGVRLMYDHVKAQNMEKELKSSYQNGVEAGYKNKQSKSSIAPAPVGSKNPPGEITRKAIAEMSIAEYKKSRDKIMKSLDKLAAEGEQSGVL